MEDLTVIYLTANAIPDSFAEYQRKVLLEAIGTTRLISVSRKPIDFGDDRMIDDKPRSLSNIYFQMLRAAMLAKTPYVAIAEDDTFYPMSHFTFYRPDLDTFSYNQNRMALFTWGEPMYHWRNRRSNSTLIAPRELLVEALYERFTKWPLGTPDDLTGEVGRRMVEKNLDLIPRKVVDVYSKVSVIQVNHDNASEERQRTHRKSYGPIRAYDIPHWGKAVDFLKRL